MWIHDYRIINKIIVWIYICIYIIILLLMSRLLCADINYESRELYLKSKIKN